MTSWRVVFLLALFVRTAGANEPPLRCYDEPSSETGYVWGSLYAGFLATPKSCATIYSARGWDRFPILLMAGALLQLGATAGTDTQEQFGVQRARLTVGARLLRRFTLVASGDAAERSVPDAYLRVDIIRTPAVIWASDNTFELWLSAGRRVVPFGLETQWSDAKLPFLEHTSTLEDLAPAQRQYGASLAVARMRHLELPMETNDTDRRLRWYAEVGVFRPFDEQDSYEILGRAFIRLEREANYNSFAFDLHLGASAGMGRRFVVDPMAEFVPDGEQRHVAIEAEARYRRVRAAAEVVAVEQHMHSATTQATQLGTGGTLTLTATLRPNPYLWSTEPLRRNPIHSFEHVDGHASTGPNFGIELDLGIDALRSELAGTETTSMKYRVAAHLFFHDFEKLSYAYTYETEQRDHTVIARLSSRCSPTPSCQAEVRGTVLEEALRRRA